jgi:hypothetical protein
VAEIYRLTKERELTQAASGKRMGISQPEVSRMFKGRFQEYSVDRLIEFPDLRAERRAPPGRSCAPARSAETVFQTIVGPVTFGGENRSVRKPARLP